MEALLCEPRVADDARRSERSAAAEAAAEAHQDNNEGCSEHAHAPLPAGLRPFLLASSAASRRRLRYSSLQLIAAFPWVPPRGGWQCRGLAGVAPLSTAGAASRVFVLQGQQITARPIFFPVIKQQVHPDPVMAVRPAPPPRAAASHAPHGPVRSPAAARHPGTPARPPRRPQTRRGGS